MRADIGSVPLMCLLSTLTASVVGYLPTEDLTNSLPNSIHQGAGFPEAIPSSEIDEEYLPDAETESESDSIYRKKASTFRRRNINTYGGRVPFNRMAYKSGYGSNRFSIAGRNPSPGIGSGLFERSSMSGGYPTYPGEEYQTRPAAPYSGLIGGSRSGYYGSTVGMRRHVPTPQRKPKLPGEYSPDYPVNDLMASFNTNSAIPSLRELATYASRYGPTYLRNRFGSPPEEMERVGGGHPVPYNGMSIPHRGGGVSANDFNMNIGTNQWNIGAASPGIMSRDMDSYQHDDTSKDTKKEKKRTTTSTTTTTQKPKPKRKSKKPATKTTTTQKPKL